MCSGLCLARRVVWLKNWQMLPKNGRVKKLKAPYLFDKKPSMKSVMPGYFLVGGTEGACPGGERRVGDAGHAKFDRYTALGSPCGIKDGGSGCVGSARQVRVIEGAREAACHSSALDHSSLVIDDNHRGPALLVPLAEIDRGDKHRPNLEGGRTGILERGCGRSIRPE